LGGSEITLRGLAEHAAAFIRVHRTTSLVSVAIALTFGLTPQTRIAASRAASWATAILGFGGVGSMARRRRGLAAPG
jgi:maltooligosyltrehalose synthase